MPETSHLSEELKEAGTQARKEFEQAFTGGGTSSADAMGSAFAQNFATSFTQHLKGADLGLGFGTVVNKLSEQVDEQLAAKLKSQLPELLRDYRQAQDQLTRAKQEDVEVSLKMQAARDAGFNKASIMLPLMQRHQELQTQLTKATKDAEDAQDKYNGALSRYQAASAGAFNVGSAMSGLLGGAMVAGIGLVVAGFENLIELGKDLFTEAIHSAVELGEELVDLGEQFENLNIGIEEFSGATGQALTDLQQHALGVWEQLDVSGKDVGRTYAQFGSMLGATAGPALDELTRRVTELQGRFGDLKAQDLGSVFVAFGLSADQANDAVASLLQTSRNAGVSLGEVTKDLAGGAAVTLQEAGLTVQQAGAVVADLAQKGLPVQSIVAGWSQAMKEFSKEGLDMSTGMKMAGEKIKALLEAGDTTDADKLAVSIFGRRAAEALPAILAFNDAVNAVPGAFDASGQSVDEFLGKTQTLGEAIEQFKHRVEGAFKPFADWALNLAEHGLTAVSDWFEQHHAQIIDKIRQFGDSFINQLPMIKEFAAEGARLLGEFAEHVVKPLVVLLLEGAGAVEAMTFHFGAAKDMLKMGNDVQHTDFAAGFDNVADKLDAWQLNTSQMQQSWDSIANSAQSTADSAQAAAAAASAMGAAGGLIMPPSAVGGAPAAGAAPGFPVPALPPSGAPGGGRPLPNGTDFPWTADQASDGQAAMAGVIYNAVMAAGYSPQTALYAVAAALKESSLNPDVTNASGHHGLFQESADKPSANAGQQINWFIDTLNRLGGPSVVDRNPKDTIADRVEVGGYPGSDYDQFLQRAQQLIGGQGGGASTASYTTSAGRVNLVDFTTPMGGPSPDISGAAMPGVYANPNSVATRIPSGPDVETGIREVGGLPTVYPTSGPGAYQVPAWAQQLAADFGLTAQTRGDGGSLHQMGYAFDFNGTPENLDRLADFISHNLVSQTLQLIHQSPLTGEDYGIASGQLVGPGTDQPGYYAADWAGHRDHVHWATDMPPIMGGAPNLMAGYAPAGLPGPDGMSPERYDRYVSDREAIQQAQDRKDDLNYQVQKANQRVTDIQQQIAAAQNDPSRLGPDQDKISKLNEQLADATHDLAVSRRELSGQDQKISDAQRKLQDDMNKPEKSGHGGGRSGADNAAHGFGQSFLSGIADELGLSNVFGSKAPWDWGSVKLGMGLLNWGAGELQQLMGGQGGGGGLDASGGSGFLGGLAGPNLAKLFGGVVDPSPGPGNFGRPDVMPGPSAAFQGGGPANEAVNPQFANAPAPAPNVAPVVYQIDQSSPVTIHNHGSASDLDAHKAYQNSYQRNRQTASKPGTFAAV